MTKLTSKQEKFVQGLVSGLSQREAFKEAGYSWKNKSNEYVDVKASELMKNGKVSVRYNDLIEEHKNKALWTREQAVTDLIWLKEQSKISVQKMGVRQANSNSMLNTIKELNAIEDLYPKNKQPENSQEKDVAAALRGLADGVITQTE